MKKTIAILLSICMLFSLAFGLAESDGFRITDADGGEVTGEQGVYSITQAGEYTVTGTLSEGQIRVEAPEDAEVRLILAGAGISSSAAAPIVIISADEVTVKSEAGTENFISDLRTGTPGEDEETGAIDAACDLNLTGKGSLTIVSTFDKGVRTKDDLSIKNVNLTVRSAGAALKGNDGVKIESGTLDLTAEGADGIKTGNASLSASGKQKGSIRIEGGSITLRAAQDGLNAACNVEISGEETVLNVYTASYSGAEGQTGGTELYLVVPNSLYSEDTDYYFYCYAAESDTGTWVRAEYNCVVYSGRSAAYVGLLAKIPGDADTLIAATVPTGTKPDGTNLTAASDAQTINTAMNAYVITAASDATLSGDWAQLATGMGMGNGNSNKTAYSSKGIKAGNEVLISGGNIAIQAGDDGIHANGNETLENGETSTGNVLISGGTLTITSADDGIHADGELTITGGKVDVQESYEGLEGNIINLAGGEVSVYAEDDGVNAGSGREDPLINITGGTLEVTTPSGDTDGIDSNGDIVMTGGNVLVRGGAAMGNMAGSVDVDGTITVTGGTIIAIGGICETPVDGSVCTYISSGASFAAGEYTLAAAGGEVLGTFTLADSYSSVWIASDQISIGESYTLTRDGEEVLTWTQSAATEGSAGNGWGNGWGNGAFGGGFGGGRGGW